MSEKNKKAKGICLAKVSNEERCYSFCDENGSGKQSAFLVEWGASLERVFCLVLGVNHWSKISHELRSRKLFLECLNGIKNLVATADLHSPSFGAVINPFTPKISIVILLTVCHTILVVLLKPIHLDAEESDYPEPREFQAYKTHLQTVTRRHDPLHIPQKRAEKASVQTGQNVVTLVEDVPTRETKLQKRKE